MHKSAFAVILASSLILSGCGDGKISRFINGDETKRDDGWETLAFIDNTIEQLEPHEIKQLKFKGVVNKHWRQPDGFETFGDNNSVKARIIPSKLRLLYTCNVSGRSFFSPNEMATPVISDNNLIYALGDDAVLRTFKLNDGSKVWEKLILSTRDIKAFDYQIGAISLTKDNIIVCLMTGEIIYLKLNQDRNIPPKEIWRYNSKYAVRSPAICHKNYVVVTSVSGHTMALEKNTGQLLWSHKCLSRGAIIMGGSVPLIHRGVVYVAYYSNEVYALSLYSGQVLWSSYLLHHESDITKTKINHVKARPLTIRDTLLVYGFDRLSFYGLKFGKALPVDKDKVSGPWEYNQKLSQFSLEVGGSENILRCGHHIFLLTKFSKLMCIDFNSRKLIWQKQLEYENENTKEITFWYGPTLVQQADGQKPLLVLTNSKGKMVFIDANNPKQTYTINTGRTPAFAPVVVNKKLIVLSSNGDIVVFGADCKKHKERK